MKNWISEYKDSAHNLDRRAHFIAKETSSQDKTFCRKVAKISMDENCTIQHALWIALGEGGDCQCLNCINFRQNVHFRQS